VASPFRPAVGFGASIALFALVGCFVVELVQDGTLLGLGERAAAGGQALWVMAAVLLIWRSC
jgi:hypothetical protein